MSDQRLDRSARRHLAVVLPANPIGKSKQPAHSACFVHRRRSGMSDEVFVVFANFAGIGKLGEFDLERARSRKAVAAGSGPGGTERNSAMTLQFCLRVFSVKLFVLRGSKIFTTEDTESTKIWLVLRRSRSTGH
jgi:hypothetical protein